MRTISADVKILTPGGIELRGILIEGKTYTRARDLAEGLGYVVEWEPGFVTISQTVREIGLDTDLRLPSGATATLLDSYLADTPLAGLGDEFRIGEGYWRVNAVFACAVACHESNFGQSRIAQDKKNLFGFGAFDSDPYVNAKSYHTYVESIDDFYLLISRQYLHPTGAYYDGPNIAGIGKRYATDAKWPEKVLRHCRAILDLERRE